MYKILQIGKWAVVMGVALAVTLVPVFGIDVTTTTITGTAGGSDSWNDATNWDVSVPTGSLNAAISNGVLAQVSAAPPAYSGSLTLQDNATLQIRNRAALPNVLGGSDIVLNDVSTLDFLDGSPDFNNMQVLGAARILARGNGAHHETFDFNGDITGTGSLFLNGVNNDTFNLNGANTFDGFVAESDANQGFRVNATATGSLGTGNVTINNAATLQVDAADAMDDGAVLSLNGIKDSRRTAKLILNGNDTIGGFFIDTVDQGFGTFSSATHPGIIGGTGVLTIAVPNVFDYDGDTFDDPADWNDGDNTIYPGAPELPDLKDNDQNGVVDNGLTPINTMSTDSGGNISYLLGSNWSLGHMPGANDSAVINDGLTAQVTSLPSGFDYAGTLTLGENATIVINDTGGDTNLDALGGAGIILNEGSKISTPTSADPHFGPIQLLGNASTDNPSNAADHDSRFFDGAITGSGSLTIAGRNNNTYHFNAASDWTGGLIANGGGWRIEANATGSLGAGDVTINNTVSLQVDAVDVMADTAGLFLNGSKDSRKTSKLIMNNDDTIGALGVDGTLIGAGSYNSGSSLTDINGVALITGVGTLTVAGVPLYWDVNGATAGTDTSSTGNWTDTSWSLDPDGGDATTYSWADGYRPVFSAGTNGTGTQTITVSGTQQVGDMTVEEGTVNLTGGTLALTGTATFDVASGATSTVASGLADAAGKTGGLTKTGDGALVLSGTNSYTGPTTVTGGTLAVTGSIASSSLTTVTGGTLSGTGTTGAVALNGGTVGPGGSVGTLSSGNTSWSDGSTYLFEIDDATGTAGSAPGWDLLDITGTLDVSGLTAGGFTIDMNTLLPGGGTNPGDMVNFVSGDDYGWEFVRTSGGITGFDETFFTLDTSGVSNVFGGIFSVRQDGDSLVLNYGTIPEPSTGILIGLGLLGLCRRRTQK